MAESLPALSTVRASDGADDALQAYVNGVIDLACGIEVKLEDRFATPTGGQFLGTLTADLKQAIQLHTARASTESEIADWFRDQGVDAASSSAVASSVVARTSELQAAAGTRAATIATGVLEDFDWSLRVVLASSTRASMTEPLVVLSLVCSGDAGDKAERVVELTRSDLDRMLANLSQIDGALARFLPVTAVA